MEIEKQIADDDRLLIGKEALKAENERIGQQLLEKIAENNLIAAEIIIPKQWFAEMNDIKIAIQKIAIDWKARGIIKP